MALIKFFCLFIVTAAVCWVPVTCESSFPSVNAPPTASVVSPKSSVVVLDSNKSSLGMEKETRDYNANDPTTGRGRIVRKRKLFLRMLLQAKMVATAIFVPGIIALTLFASWKSVIFSTVAFVMALTAILRPQAWGGREYSQGPENRVSSSGKTPPGPWPQRIHIDEFGQHKGLLHVYHHGGKKEDHHHDHHVWYHESPTSHDEDIIEDNSYTNDPYHGWASQ